MFGSKRQRRTRAIASTACITAGIVSSVLAVTSPAQALTNTSPRGLRACNPGSASISSACLSGALRDFNAARAKEHLGKLVLPSNFRSLTVPQQLLVLTNLDRRARKLPAFVGLNGTLNSYAAHGAATESDPRFPSWAKQGGSNWASTYNALWTEFMWMYDDGAGANLDCTRSNPSGCWGHRRNILTSYGSPRVMGAAGYSRTGDGVLYLGYDTHDTTFTFRWSSEARYFPGGRLP